VAKHLGSGGPCDVPRPIGRTVVDDQHVPVASRALHHATDGGALVVRGDEDERRHAVFTTSAT
jgi:hypothetical protein